MKVLKSVLILALVLGVVGGLATVSAQDKVKVTWWHITTDEAGSAYWQDLADQFMDANPNVEIEITILENEAFKSRIVTVMQAGEPPDIFQSWGGGVLAEFAEAGMLRDITPEIEAGWGDTFAAQGALNIYKVDGKNYGVPWTWGVVGFFYNKALFAEAGIEALPETWDEYLAAVQALKDAGITPISLGGREKWPGAFWYEYLAMRLGGEEAFMKAFNREGSFADEPFVQAGEYLKQLIDMEPFPEGFMGLGYGDQAGLVGDAEAAMELMGQWAASVEASNSEQGGIGDDLGFFGFPAIPEGAGNPNDALGGGDGFAVGKDAPDEAVAFLQFITSVEAQLAGSEIWILPTVAGAETYVVEDPIMSEILTIRNEAPYSQLYWDQFMPPAVGEAVNDATEALFAGAASPKEVAGMIEDAAFFELEG
jgi:raffinose/stachyose/melibiose transport system substrate-binding protein